jgi:hypothetical protein
VEDYDDRVLSAIMTDIGKLRGKEQYPVNAKKYALDFRRFKKDYKVSYFLGLAVNHPLSSSLLLRSLGVASSMRRIK